MTGMNPLSPAPFQLPPVGFESIPGMLAMPPNIRYGFGGAQSATTETNKPTTVNGQTMPSTAETPSSPFDNIFGKPLSFEQQRTLAKDDEARSIRELERLEAFRLREAEKMFQYGFKSNLIASILKDIPKAIAAPANRYNEVMRNVLDIQRQQQPLFALKGGTQDFSSSFRTRA